MKANANWNKHGASFQEATTVFDGALGATFADPATRTQEAQRGQARIKIAAANRE